MVELTKKQINKLMKGGAIQLSPSHLKGMNEDFLEGLHDKTIKKMVRALKEGRGMRLKLNHEEMEKVGGKLNIGKAFKNLGHTVEKGFHKTFTPEVGNQIVKGLQQTGKVVGRPLINGVVDAGVLALTTMAGNPELAPVLTPMVNAGVNRALDRAHLGFGVGKEELKQIKSAMMKHLKPHLEVPKHILPLVNKVFKHGEHILDLDEIPIKGGKINLKHIGKKIKEGAKHIYHHAKPVLKHFGEQAIEMAKPMLSEAMASYGVDPMTSELLINSGEQLAKRGLDKYVTKEKSQTPEYALEHHGNKTINSLQNKANKTLDSLQNRSSEYINKYVPEEYRPQFQEQIQDMRNQANEQVQDMRDQADQQIQESASYLRRHRGGRIGMIRKVYSYDDIIPVRGGALQKHMGTLLDYTNPAMRPFIYPPNQPQGFKSGGSFRGYGNPMLYSPMVYPPNQPQGVVSGGSFTGYGRIRSKYGGSFM